jgi:hypothetical protein
VATERILVLASSKKGGGRCVAGISLESGRWVRPVSTVGGGAVSTFHCGVNGRYPRVREVATFEARRRCPLPEQPENVLVGVRTWQLEERLSRAETAAVVGPILSPGPELLGGLDDTVSEGAVLESPMIASLAIVEPKDLVFEHERVPWGNGSRIWAQFFLGGAYHAIRLTDTVIAPRMAQHDPGTYGLETIAPKPPSRLALTVSLGESFQGVHYKLAAAVVGLE